MNSPLDVSDDPWEILPHEIIIDHKIADGNFGEVYKANLASVPTRPHEGVRAGESVAIKLLKGEQTCTAT